MERKRSKERKVTGVDWQPKPGVPQEQPSRGSGATRHGAVELEQRTNPHGRTHVDVHKHSGHVLWGRIPIHKKKSKKEGHEDGGPALLVQTRAPSSLSPPARPRAGLGCHLSPQGPDLRVPGHDSPQPPTGSPSHRRFQWSSRIRRGTRDSPGSCSPYSRSTHPAFRVPARRPPKPLASVGTEVGGSQAERHMVAALLASSLGVRHLTVCFPISVFLLHCPLWAVSSRQVSPTQGSPNPADPTASQHPQRCFLCPRAVSWKSLHPRLVSCVLTVSCPLR